jgi:hypothetical protein
MVSIFHNEWIDDQLQFLKDMPITLKKYVCFDAPLNDFSNRIDDDFARRIGGMVLLTLASRSKIVKDQLSTTTERKS